MDKKLLALVVSLSITSTVQAETPSLQQMWQLIKDQQAQIEELKAKIKDNDIKTEATISAVEQFAVTPVKANKTTFGGYGEVHYNNLEQDNGSNTTDAIDFHRFVMFTGHQFTDKIRFFSELEVEHSIAGEGQVGEIELEQAYIEWDASESLSAKAGLFLMPIGILNETHEPDTFYGTERNNVEKNIIPATWWEAGGAVNGELSQGLSYDVAAHSGLYIAEGNHRPRDGRQKVGKAKADNMAFTGRLKYTAIPGLELAASLQYQTDVRQGEGASIDGTLFETHVAWQTDGFQMRALYAQWDFDDVLNATKEGASEQSGFYIEPSYKFNENLGVFARYSQWDNTAGAQTDSKITQLDLGINYWLHRNVVFKVDYQNQDAPNGNGYDGINMGVGYSF